MAQQTGSPGHRAADLLDRGQSRAALAIWRQQARQLSQSGADPAVLLEALRPLCTLYDRATALALLEEATTKAGVPPPWQLRFALHLLREGWYADAAIWAERAGRAAGPDRDVSVDARLLLAECRERLGQLEEALDLIGEVVRTHPASLPAQRLRATILRRRGDPEGAAEALQPLLDRGAPAHWETCRAWFELGHIEDRRGRYAQAWHCWTEARKFYPPDSDWPLFRQQAAHVWQQVQAVHRTVTTAQLHRWADGPEHRPMAILTGHPRSGTTLLEQALDAHRGIVSAEETTVFSAAVYRPLFQHGLPLPPALRLDRMSLEELTRWQAEYFHLMGLAQPAAGPSTLLLDKNPDLLQLLPAVARVLPHARILVMLRDPRDLLVSMFSQPLPPNHTAWSYRTVTHAGRMIALRLGLWHHLRQRWTTGRFLELRYEKTVQDFPGAVDQAVRFLGLTPESASHHPETHSRQRLVLSPTYAAVQEPVHRRAIGRWQNYQPWLEPALAALAPAVRGLGYE